MSKAEPGVHPEDNKDIFGAEPVRVNVCGALPLTGLMRHRWSPGSRLCWFSAQDEEGGVLLFQGVGLGPLAGAQHITPAVAVWGSRHPAALS